MKKVIRIHFVNKELRGQPDILFSENESNPQDHQTDFELRRQCYLDLALKIIVFAVIFSPYLEAPSATSFFLGLSLNSQ